jgi:hypothetical protein
MAWYDAAAMKFRTKTVLGVALIQAVLLAILLGNQLAKPLLLLRSGVGRMRAGEKLLPGEGGRWRPSMLCVRAVRCLPHLSRARRAAARERGSTARTTVRAAVPERELKALLLSLL